MLFNSYFNNPVQVLSDRIEYPAVEERRVFVLDASKAGEDYDYAASQGGSVSVMLDGEEAVFLTSEFLWAVGCEAAIIAIRLEMTIARLTELKGVTLKSVKPTLRLVKSTKPWLKAA